MYIIRQLRQKKGVNQSHLADAIGVSLRTIQNYERKDASIPSKNLAKIATYFDLTIAELYQRQLSENGEPYSKTKSFTKHGCVFYPMEHGKYHVVTPLVSVERQKNYIESLAESRLGNSPYKTAFIIDFLEDGPHKAFEVSGDSMNDGSIDAIPNKSIVLGIKTKKENFAIEGALMSKEPYVLVCKDRIICKEVASFDASNKTIRCQNLNQSPEYQDFDLAITDVLEVVRIFKKQL